MAEDAGGNDGAVGVAPLGQLGGHRLAHARDHLDFACGGGGSEKGVARGVRGEGRVRDGWREVEGSGEEREGRVREGWRAV